MKILFVCMGNICRSPTAEGVFRKLLEERGLSEEIEVDSAGTGDWHAGAAPDPRSTEAAARRGITLQGAARQVKFEDFYIYDLLVAMDRDNVHELLALAPDGDLAEKVVLLREYDPASADSDDLDVPDPYYGGPNGFDDVLDLVDAGARGLLQALRPA
ncbi:MAG TPA: low molecular weight protein-tyrosine-phosphatase [Baekduia sp.]|nr:low molecular weight protein-tyrosine-phosphatase [Baekduia sp.]